MGNTIDLQYLICKDCGIHFYCACRRDQIENVACPNCGERSLQFNGQHQIIPTNPLVFDFPNEDGTRAVEAFGQEQSLVK